MNPFRKERGNTLLIVVIVVVVLIVVSGGIYYLYQQQSSRNKAVPTSNTETLPAIPASSSSPSASPVSSGSIDQSYQNPFDASPNPFDNLQ